VPEKGVILSRHCPLAPPCGTVTDAFEIGERVLLRYSIGILGIEIEKTLRVRGSGPVAHGFPHHHRRNPFWQASTAVARTHPLVVQPVMTSVSTRCATNRGTRSVPKKHEAYFLSSSVSVLRKIEARIYLPAISVGLERRPRPSASAPRCRDS
jgi:hypothetical protein